MIRPLEEKDVPQLLEMGAVFAKLVDKPTTYSQDRVTQILNSMMSDNLVGAPASAAFVYVDEDDTVGGIIMGAVAPVWFAEEYAAIEIALWVQPSIRGRQIANELVAAFEGWGKEHGANFVTMSDLSIGGEYPAGKVFERLGYTRTERSWMKEV